MTIAGAEGWFRFCERFSAGQQVYLYSTHTHQAAVTAHDDLDVDMAEAPFIHSHTVGKKRSRNDDGDEDALEYQMRLEKVCSAPK